MAGTGYDVIVVGARCAGSPAAMLLARQGFKVLVVDRATFPSDTISTHLIHPPGVAALRRWGLLDRLIATGCPPIPRYVFDVGPFALEGTPGPADDSIAYAPRRTVLDKLLVDAAAEAGAEVREGFLVDEILLEAGRVTGVRGRDGRGAAVTERADVVIGADGLRSCVAQAVRPEQYHDRAPLEVGYYSYWSGLPMAGRFEAWDRGDRAFAAWPTNDDLTLVIVSWPFAEFENNKREIERCYREAIARAPGLAARMADARRETPFAGMFVPGFFRKPYGPGWALVGDAGYHKDFITAQGITDAFRDAELCAAAVHDALSGRRGWDEAMGGYQARRDAQVMPMFEFTCQFAQLQPPPPELQAVLGAAHGNPEAMDGFVRVFSGLVSPAEYFSPENVGRILAAAG
jgi:2-polyprenyl-6-methoxyphenol hydroxylase-like FAD-dependent oxidoreductase